MARKHEPSWQREVVSVHWALLPLLECIHGSLSGAVGDVESLKETINQSMDPSYALISSGTVSGLLYIFLGPDSVRYISLGAYRQLLSLLLLMNRMKGRGSMRLRQRGKDQDCRSPVRVV